MKANNFVRPAWCLLLALSMTGFSGCQKLKDIFQRAPRDEVVQRTRTIKMAGYEQTVMVKATLEELDAYLSGSPEEFDIKGVEVGQGGEELGSTFPFHVERMGLNIKGFMILIKSEGGDLWYVWHNPQLFQLQRWEFKEVKDGVRIKLDVHTETIKALEMIPGMDKMAEALLKEIDLMLARIQAHFDPELEAEDLVAKGLRGQSYEKLYKIHESSVWIDASPEETIGWMDRNPDKYMSEYQTKEDCPWESSEPVIYCPFTASFGPVSFDLDSFTINEEGKKGLHKMYWTGLGLAGWLEWKTEAEAGGTRYFVGLALETPGAMSPLGVDALMLLAGVPAEMRKSMLKVKNGVEGRGEI